MSLRGGQDRRHCAPAAERYIGCRGNSEWTCEGAGGGRAGLACPRVGDLDPEGLRHPGAEMLLLDDGRCFRDQALEVCSMAGECEFRATSLTTLLEMVAGGAGVTLLPALSRAAEAKRARLRLRIRRMASPKAHRTIALVWRKRAPLEPALREIAGVLREAFPVPAPVAGRSDLEWRRSIPCARGRHHNTQPWSGVLESDSRFNRDGLAIA